MKLSKQLAAIRRELTASPKKAAALGLLLVAAAWFWGPIVWRLTAGSSKGPPAKTPAATVAGIGQQPAAGHPQPARRTSAWGWNELLAARERDPLTRAVAFDADWPQPFKVRREVAARADAAGNPSLLLTPSEAGLVLGSILYGRTTRVAVINGGIYHEGSEVSVAAPQGTAVTFEIRRIERERVALDRLERTYWLDFPRPTLAGADRIEASEKSARPPASEGP
jgi:hypothetical protein